MRLQIYNDKYVIKSDPRQYLLYEIREKQKEEELLEDLLPETDTEENSGFYDLFLASCTTISQALKFIVQREKRLTGSKTWEEYFKHLQEVQNKMDKTYADIVDALGEDITNKKIEEQTQIVLAHGEPKGEPPKKRGRKKKE